MSIKIFLRYLPANFISFNTSHIFLIQNIIFNSGFNMPRISFDIEHNFRVSCMNLYDKDQDQGDNHRIDGRGLGYGHSNQH